jgi:Bacterial extracellular solute-binding proteins, family 5 Middle
LPYLHTGEAPVSAFPGFTTCTTCVTLSWWLYTAAFNYVQFFDDSLYFIYNSRFVSGIPSIQPPGAPCSTQSVPTNTAADYVYLCSPNYDNLSNQMEFSPCLSASGDPRPGQTSNLPVDVGNGICPGTNQLSAHSAGIQAEAAFGAGAFTIPVFERTLQFGYVNGWIRVINGDGVGLPNYFTWLDAYNPTPAVPGTIRQGFSQITRSVNPFIASTRQDTYIVGNIYDPLARTNPLDLSQQINWMVYSSRQLDNATVMSNGYSPPPGTLTTYRFFLRNDAFFQDGRPVTAYDVAFSYLSMVGSGSNLGTGASTITGITVLAPRVIDIGVNSLGPFTLQKLTTVPILPGRYWTGAGSPAWDSAVMTCTGASSCATAQFALSGSTVACPSGVHPGCSSFPANLMQVDPSKTTATFDPIVSGILIGSGPWECKNANSVLGAGCTSTGSENPPVGGTYTLTRFGAGLPPASSSSGTYFRSSGDLALSLWSQENDINPILPVAVVSLCFNQPINFGNCAHWQHGIGASSNGIVGINQVSAVELRYNLNWVSPFEWATNPPLGIGAFPPVLYDGSVTLNPCSIDSVNGYDC